MERKLTKEQLAEHQRNVVSAAYTYHNIHWMTITALAEAFNVTGNQIAEWLCEAISKRYVPDDSVCERIRNKHIEEYEATLRISNSSLRQKYSVAFDARMHAPHMSEPNYITA